MRWSDGHASTYRAIWLRDNCCCPECRHSGSNQRLIETAAIPSGIEIERTRRSDGRVEIAWTDGHGGTFPTEWLRAACPCPEHRAARRRRRRLWGAEIAGALPKQRYDDVARDDAALGAWLSGADALGFAILTGVPAVPGWVERVAELFGHVRETNYGRVFDVRSVVDPNNLAYTGLPLGVHTDNPYRDPTPPLQLLHCLSSSARGGETTLVDGFRVAAELRTRARDAFDVLARTPVRFRFRDRDTELEAVAPIIEVDVRGDVVAIRFNNRSLAPLELDDDLVEPYYDAHRTFARLLESPEFSIRFRLDPGELFLVDNTRVLHGRTGFSDMGERHLQGCYADRDGLRSRLAVLSREREGAG